MELSSCGLTSDLAANDNPHITNNVVVSYTVVMLAPTYAPPRVLHDDTKDGCIGDS